MPNHEEQEQDILILRQQLAEKEALLQEYVQKKDLADTILAQLLEHGKAIASELELEKLVQRITDIGTSLSGAAFGAFFYNVENPSGESYLLYTISGVPREAFSRFPMPRNTKIFAPTFNGSGTVRYDDVTRQSHYGQHAPYHGMPPGHLPVKSYLAVPVISATTGEVIGGLFFGHHEAGRFTETSEKLVEGIAAQAAIAVANARLFEQKNRAEKKLTEQNIQFQDIFDSVADAILVYDAQGCIVQANPAAAKMHGYTQEELATLHGNALVAQPGFLFRCCTISLPAAGMPARVHISKRTAQLYRWISPHRRFFTGASPTSWKCCMMSPPAKKLNKRSNDKMR